MSCSDTVGECGLGVWACVRENSEKKMFEPKKVKEQEDEQIT
jgi:hypothetical protein